MTIPFSNNTQHGGSINVDVDVGTGSEEGQILYYDATNSQFTDTSIIHIDATNNRVGINKTNPEEDLDIDGNIQLNNASVGKIVFYDNNDDHEHAEVDALDDGATGGQLQFKTKADGGSVATHLTIKEDGKTGIGTTSPSFKLDVQDTNSTATLNIRSSATAVDGVGSKIIFGQTGDSIAQIEGKYNGGIGGSNKDLLFYSAGNTVNPKMILNGNGRLGVGTNATSLIHAYGNEANPLLIERNASSTNCSMECKTQTDSVYFGINGSDNACIGHALDQTNAPFQISSAGNVGIGTTSPDDLLHIEGDTATISTTQLTLEGRYYGYGAGVDFVSRTSPDGTRLSMAKITADGESSFDTTPANQNAGLRFFTTSGGTQAEKMRINNTGYVGIGTTNPLKTLHVKKSDAVPLMVSGYSTLTAGSSAGSIQLGETDAYCGRFQFDNSTTKMYIDNTYDSSNGDINFRTRTSGTAVDALTIKGGGNVGIGTTSPSVPLQVVGTSSTVGLSVLGSGEFITDDFGSTFKTTNALQKRSQIFFKDATNTITSRIGNDIDGGNNSKLQFIGGSGSTPHMSITDSGYVGIGDTTPSYQLELSTDSAGKPTSSTWTITSDERVKSNVVDADLQTCYDLVKNLPLKRYEWSEKYLPNVEDRHMLGWIAQDVKKVLPKSIKTHSKTFVVGKELENVVETVVETNDETGEQVEKQIEKQVEKEITETIDDFLSLDSDQIIKMLFGAVQKLQKEVEELKGLNTH